ncbi:MAG TPA: hypothetical protein IAB79_07530 [Candidatus Faecousia excrementipullorum]|nr:hypothetical protein [Candidatus Faecousia excrementipullorum]
MEKGTYTRWERFSNWFYYNKWWLFVGVVLIYVAGTMVYNALGIGQTAPDYTISYVGTRQLPQTCVSALEEELAGLGEDVNGDGVVTVRLTQHTAARGEGGESALYSYGAEVTLLADIIRGESCFFLLEDPEMFQKNYQVLANLDGSIPLEDDLSGLDKVYRWGDCPVLTGLELGTYADAYLDMQEEGTCQDLLKNLYVGRRFFWDLPENNADYQTMWQRLTQGAVQ